MSRYSINFERHEGLDLNRPASPLLHDYKPSPDKNNNRLTPVRWFAAGLGIPLIGLAMFLVADGDSGKSTSTVAVRSSAGLPEMTSVAPLQPVDDPVASLDDHRLADATDEFHPPLIFPAPDYDSIHLTIKSGDTLDRLFRRHDLSLANLAAIIKLPQAKNYLRKVMPGDVFDISHDHGQLISLYRELDLTRALVISKKDDGFAAEIVERPIEIRTRRAYGRIESSLFESATAAGLPDKLIMNLAGIFAWDIDFVLDIRRKDDYYILYEEVYQDGQFVADGEIIAAEFNNNGHTFRAIRFIDNSGRSDYYTPDGRSVRKAFIRAPVEFSRISSSFNPRRRHPILNTIRAHRGVDYAAPRGTPVKAAGDGKIIFRGVKGGYGNAIILQHGSNITTLYAHMSSFDSKARFGQRVVQGQTIGYVGSTGLATAAHLHYEYRLNGVYRNPRTVELPQAQPIKDEYRQDFLATVGPIMDELMQYKRMQIAALPAS